MAVPDHLQQQLDRGQQLRSEGIYRGRYAPSPTGVLHRGNLQTALLSWLQARQQRGVWLLRIDDLDTPRNRAGAVEAIQADLRWLGLTWDGPVILQSHRRGIYASWLSWLRRNGVLFPCRVFTPRLGWPGALPRHMSFRRSRRGLAEPTAAELEAQGPNRGSGGQR